MSVVLELRQSAEQTSLNLKRWEEVQADPYLAKLPHRIETDRYGNIVMTPPAAMPHGTTQAEIAHLLKTLLPEGIVATECPISTADGVKATDVGWLAGNRHAETARICLTVAPDICVEIMSPSNTKKELLEKAALYFEAGAKEVWIIDTLGSIEVFNAPSNRIATSRICPDFPLRPQP
ncbi:MAG: Uma2 family endonuclease [Verrucomicrobia bacterium]|nr:Uma2 family endonuclease [Verrucomicrobiota bacterium]MBV8483345.1 Uma2 family endonuclease [Verrucomicrobiota bacterium]